MVYERNLRQVRQMTVTNKEKDQVNKSHRHSDARSQSEKARETTFSKFPLCKTSTGWFCSCHRCCCFRRSKIQENLGVGVSIYFKQLKNLIILMCICTLLSMPAFVLFWSGRSLNNPDTQEGSMTLDIFIASLSLANLGEKSINLNVIQLGKPQ